MGISWFPNGLCACLLCGIVWLPFSWHVPFSPSIFACWKPFQPLRHSFTCSLFCEWYFIFSQSSFFFFRLIRTLSYRSHVQRAQNDSIEVENIHFLSDYSLSFRLYSMCLKLIAYGWLWFLQLPLNHAFNKFSKPIILHDLYMIQM